jgi:hypothetical protein
MTDLTASTTRERTTLATIVLAVTGLSAIGFVVSMVGHIANWNGFDDGGESTAAGDTFWLMYFLAGIAALVLGGVALAKAWRNGPASERSAGQLAVAYAVVSVLLIVLVDTLFD